jgi:hypothetical protein
VKPCKRHTKQIPNILDPMVVLSDFNWHMIMEDTVFPNYNFDPFELIDRIEGRNGCSICYFGSEGVLYLKELLKTYQKSSKSSKNSR